MDHESIKRLRARTQAGILACKKALEQSDGDIDEAERLIRSETKKIMTDRVASKGLIHLKIEGDQAIIYEMNGETDFIVKHKAFIDLVEKIGEPLMRSDAQNPTDANDVLFEARTIREEIDRTRHICDEQLELRRFYRMEKRSDQIFGSYDHNGKTIGLVVLESDDLEFARDIAMQIVSQDLEITDNQNIENAMIKLYRSPFIKDQTKTVEDILNMHDARIDRFYRFELGQGIEDKLICRLDLPCDASTIKIPS